MADKPADLLVKAVAALLQRECKSFLAGPLASRLASVETNPRFQFDPVARNIAAQVGKLADKDPKALVTANQIERFYNELRNLNPSSEFKQEFADLFATSIVQAQAEVSTEVPTEIERARHNFTDHGDRGQVVVEENQEFEPYEAPQFEVGASFKPEQHRFAETAIKQELTQFGADGVRVGHKTNGPNLMIYLAQFATPTGRHQVVVPIQVEGELVKLPEVFGKDDRAYSFSKEGFAKFEQDNLQVVEVKATNAADTIRRAESIDAPRPMSAIQDFINSDEDTIEVEDEEFNVFEDTPLQEGLNDVEAVLADAVLRKQSSHHSHTINRAHELVARELKSIGQHTTPVFAGDGKNGDLLFAAKLVKNHRIAEVTVPVETQGENIQFPTKFQAGNQAYSFNGEGVEQVFSQDAIEKPVLLPTDLAKANYKSLRQVVYAATMNGKPETANEAITAIATKYGKDAVANVMRDYQHWLRVAQTATVDAPPQTDPGHKMTQDDWAANLQHEINDVTNGRGIEVPEELGKFDFEQYDEPGYEGTIMTNRIDNIELT